VTLRFTEESVRLRENRIGAVCAIAGAMLLLAGTWLHPMPADPNNAIFLCVFVL
jgi:hypothetical protein